MHSESKFRTIAQKIENELWQPPNALAYNRNIYFVHFIFYRRFVVFRFCTACRFCAIGDKINFGSTFGQPQIDLFLR